VIFQRTGYDDDGDLLTPIGTLVRDGDQAIHRSLGLIEYAATRLRKRISEDDE
jgi:hypothetical protein